tara:strand:- start:26 stop:364 length:339 start_codon:yes stop_codon:yes gene_type:complete
MAYGINSNIQARRLTDEIGAVVGAVAFSIPLTARTLMLSPGAVVFMAMSEHDLDIAEKRIVISSTTDDMGGARMPFIMPSPSGANGQLWFKAVETGAIIPLADSFMGLMILE